MTSAEMLLTAVASYLAAGLVFGLFFVTVGVARIDHSARGTSKAFRLIILPGSVALWPFLAVKWARARGEAT